MRASGVPSKAHRVRGWAGILAVFTLLALLVGMHTISGDHDLNDAPMSMPAAAAAVDHHQQPVAVTSDGAVVDEPHTAPMDAPMRHDGHAMAGACLALLGGCLLLSAGFLVVIVLRRLRTGATRLPAAGAWAAFPPLRPPSLAVLSISRT